MSNPPDFDSIDWVALVRSMGIHLPTGEPFVYEKWSATERQALAEYLTNTIANDPSLPKGYIADYLDDMVYDGRIATFDKAWVRLLVNRSLQ